MRLDLSQKYMAIITQNPRQWSKMFLSPPMVHQNPKALPLSINNSNRIDAPKLPFLGNTPKLRLI